MQSVTEQSELFGRRGFAASRQLARTSIHGVEHRVVPLPAGMIREDGTLDIYADVGKLFRPMFDNGIPSIQCGGWVGYIPLNDQYALEVSPRVPIGNLERLIGMAEGFSPRVLEKYTRHFAHSDDLPAAFFDVIADQLLGAFDGVWESGLLKAYRRERRVGSSPLGRIEPFPTAWRTAKAGVPIAVSSAFHRVADIAENRILRFAFEKLLARYHGNISQNQRRRILRIRQAVARLEDVGKPSHVDLAPDVLSRLIHQLPSHKEDYADALMLAQLINSESGFAIRGNDGMAILPSIVVDMWKVFEFYIRRVLADHFRNDPDVVVWDGNNAAPDGAKLELFDPVEVGVKNVPVTPDIVIEAKGEVRLIIDTKYKPAPKQPDRDDVNQVVLYGSRYGAKRVMLLHAGRGDDETNVTLLGKVGEFQVYNGRANLNAIDIEEEERQLARSVAALL